MPSQVSPENLRIGDAPQPEVATSATIAEEAPDYEQPQEFQSEESNWPGGRSRISRRKTRKSKKSKKSKKINKSKKRKSKKIRSKKRT